MEQNLLADQVFKYSEDPDVKLMLEYQNGNTAAFHTLYERNKTRVFVWLYRMVQKEAVAEELAQEVFLRVYRARYRYKPKARFKTWLYTIAARLAFNETRRRSHSMERLDSTTDSQEGEIMKAVSPDPSALDHVEAHRLRKTIKEFLSQLGERQRAALTLRYFEELSHEDIGEILDIRIGAVKSLLHRGLVALEAILSKEGIKKEVRDD